MPETATQTLHRLTSYALEGEWTAPDRDPRIVQDLEVNDFDRLPWAYKRYDEGLPRLALPAELPAGPAPALAVLAGARAEPAELDAAQLARLLFLSAGVVRTIERDGRTIPFRAAGSAGGRFPLEVYAAVPEGGAVSPGVHRYDPAAHALVQVGPAPAGNAPAVVVTGVPWRTGWRYRERGFRHVYWDAGTMLSQLLALAASAGLDARLVTRFPDAEVDRLVGADGVHEWAVAVVALGPGRIAPSGEAAAGATDRAPLEFPLVTAAQRAGALDAWGGSWPAGEPVEAPEAPAEGPTLDEVVLRRSSQRRMDASRSLPRGLLAVSLDVAMRGIEVPHWVVVHAVDGVPPGLYRWPDLETPVRAGNLREELHVVAYDQGLARDAAFVVVAATRVADLDDRGYREAQLAAGLVEGRLHLAAYAQGASASGMTFRDSEIPGLLGEPVDGLLLTCVGVPEYASRPGGRPGAPTTFRPVAPRLDGE